MTARDRDARVTAEQAGADQGREPGQHRDPQQPPDPRHPRERAGLVAAGTEDVLGAVAVGVAGHNESRT